jgi:hypothetical protein
VSLKAALKDTSLLFWGYVFEDTVRTSPDGRKTILIVETSVDRFRYTDALNVIVGR